ncbi:hypothetical protein M427DRAFT_143237 [Gonapodya prolifera JEL478]|uniref:WW domain-containing protein n=1 Tax=Gonapodya prolifera (strain JEL478) TaxID=1344416 RepID=A0A139ARS3_GONPJ|nr:hypothetical protein M427DRAFT_143237 [Gonapodya prolifera JEL478]|eukprot:KXS19432.1 hypothetical protein M427DRAFT_143237 [Gonapodya prolifera JEL478]
MMSQVTRHATHRAINSVIETEEVLGPLPSGWIVGKTPGGRAFYVEQSTKTVTWVDPRTKSVREHDITRIKPGVLPYGWEEAADDNKEIYYIDHTTRTTYREPPWNPSVQQYAIALKRYLAGELKPAPMMKELATSASEKASRRATMTSQQQPAVENTLPEQINDAVQKLSEKRTSDGDVPPLPAPKSEEEEALRQSAEKIHGDVPPLPISSSKPVVETMEPVPRAPFSIDKLDNQVSDLPPPAAAKSMLEDTVVPQEEEHSTPEEPSEALENDAPLSSSNAQDARGETQYEDKIAHLAKINAELEEEAQAVQEENKHAHEELEAVKAQLAKEAEERKKLESLVIQLQRDVLGIVQRRGSSEEANVAAQLAAANPFAKPNERPLIEVAEEDEEEEAEEEEEEEEAEDAEEAEEAIESDAEDDSSVQGGEDQVGVKAEEVRTAEDTRPSVMASELAALKQRLEQERKQNQTLQMATSSMADSKTSMEASGEYRVPGWVKEISKTAATSKTVRIKIKDRQKMNPEGLTFADKMLYFTAEAQDSGNKTAPKAVTSLATPITKKGTRKIKGPKETAMARRLQLTNLQEQFAPTTEEEEEKEH